MQEGILASISSEGPFSFERALFKTTYARVKACLSILSRGYDVLSSVVHHQCKEIFYEQTRKRYRRT